MRQQIRLAIDEAKQQEVAISNRIYIKAIKGKQGVVITQNEPSSAVWSKPGAVCQQGFCAKVCKRVEIENIFTRIARRIA